MSLFDTEKALQKALQNVPNIPEIAWPNVKFEPVINTAFVRPTLLPSNSDVYTLNDVNKHQGIYQIDIYIPANEGIKRLYDIADDIKTYYQDNKRLTSNSQQVFIMPVEIGKSEMQGAWYTSFVEIKYISYN